jgi:hypothetical protein
MMVATEDEAYAVTKLNTEKRLQIQICLPDGETVAMTWRLGDTEQLTNQIER